MEDINLHFTGDFHAIGAANNLLCRHAGQPHLSGQRAEHRPQADHAAQRCVDMNDRQLRFIVDGLGGTGQRRAARGRLRHHRCHRDHGRALPGPRDQRPEGAPRPHGRGLYLRRAARDCGRSAARQGAMAALLKDAHQAQPGADAGGHARAWSTAAPLPTSPTAATRVIATRMALAAGRLRGHGGRLRRGSGRGKVPGHQVPHGGPAPLGRGRRGHRPRAEACTAALAKTELGERESRRRWKRGIPNLLRHVANIKDVYRPALRRRGQPLPDRHRRGARLRRSNRAARWA